MGITQLFGSRNFVVVNKTLIKLLGLEEAVILGELASEYDYWESSGKLDDEGYFFSTVENVEENTSLTKYRQKKALDTLQKFGIVDVKRKGLPAKRYIKIYEESLLKLLDNKKSKNFTSSDKKFLPLGVENFDCNNNNKINNKINNNNIIKESKKESNTETEKSVVEVSNVQKSKRKSFDEIIERYANGDERLELLLKQLLQMRFAKKRVTTNAVLNQLLDKLTQFGKTDIGKIKVLENSILKGYPDVYELSKEELEEVHQNELCEMQMKRPEEWEAYIEFLKKPIRERMEIIKCYPEWRLVDPEAEAMNERWGKYHGEETET